MWPGNSSASCFGGCLSLHGHDWRTWRSVSQGADELSSEFFLLQMFSDNHLHKSVRCVVAVSENCGQLSGSEMWGIVQSAYAQCALMTCSLTTLKPFSLSLEKVSMIPIVEGTSLQYLQDAGAPGPRNSTLLVSIRRYGTSFIEGTASTAVMRNDFVFVYGLGADVEANHHEQNIRFPGT